MANSTGDAGGSKASRSAPIGISGAHSFRQFGQDGGGGPRRAVAGGALGSEFFNRTGTTTAAGAVPLAQLLTACLAGSGADVSATADPRKDAVQSGVALVMRGLLQTMYAYCEGPPSTPQVEAELAKQLIEAGRVLRRYGRHVASGVVGNVGSQGWATHRVRTN